jgi:ribosomal protein S12 methylthiotransferase accessory factor
MIPAAPRLHPRCHLIPDPPGVVLRRGKVDLRVTGADRTERLMAMLALLDGRPAEAALSALGLPFLRDGIRILEELDTAGMLVEHGRNGAAHLLPELPALDLLPGFAVAVIGSGAPAEHLAAELARAGAVVTEENARLRIVCPDGAHLAMLEEFDQHARKSAQTWMPVFRLGDDLIAGPIFEPNRPGCFRCFELRWLGLARSVECEMAYFRWLRGDGWRKETVSPAERAILIQHAIRAASGWLSGGTEPHRVSFLDLQTGQSNAPLLWPHPGCVVCGGTWPQRPGSTIWTAWQAADPGLPIERLADRLERVVDDRIGLVGRIETVALPLVETFLQQNGGGVARSPSLVAKVGQFAIPDVEKLTAGSTGICGGLEATDRLARLVAIVEGLERYCGPFSRPPHVVSPYQDVSGHAIRPTLLPLFSEAQYRQPDFPFRRFRPEEPLSWMWGYSLTHDTPRLVPRSAVTYGPTDDRLVDECSSGVAAGTSVVDATLRGVFEMVERDAFMIFWLNRLSPPRLDWDSLPEGFTTSAVAEIRALGHEPFALNATTDLGVPVFIGGAIRSDGKYPALALGAGCAFDPQQALDKAFRELLGALRWHHVDPEWSLKPPRRPDEVKRLDDHHTAYSHPQWLTRAQFLWSSTDRQRLDELAACARPGERPGEQLAAAVDIMRRHGMEVIAVDLTTPDVAETGIRVVRAVIPGLQPIGFGEHAARLGGQRLYRAPCRMGYRSVPLEEHELNRDPHCFP